MKPEDYGKIKKRLIDIYEGYIKNDNDSNVRSNAQNLFFEFVYMSDSLDRDLVNAVNGLEHIGWEYSRSTKIETQWKMPREEAIKILNALN